MPYSLCEYSTIASPIQTSITVLKVNHNERFYFHILLNVHLLQHHVGVCHHRILLHLQKHQPEQVLMRLHTIHGCRPHVEVSSLQN